MIEEKNDLYEKNQGHRDWPTYRKAFAEAGSNQRYKDITKECMDVRTEIEEALKKADSDWAERYVEFRIENTKLNLTWSKRNFLGKRFERLDEVSLELITEIVKRVGPKAPIKIGGE